MCMAGRVFPKTILSGLRAGTFGIALTGSATVAIAQSEKSYIIDLPTLSLDQSLTHLARQIRISIDFSTYDLNQTKRPAILGLYTLENALNAVLTGTGYTYNQIGPGAYRIIRVVKKAESRQHDQLDLKAAASPFSDDMIIIHATKRAGVAARLPLSLSITDSAQLERLQITDTNSLALHTAGMSSTNLGPSRNKIFIRGISDGSFTGRQQATIGAYMDNIRLNYNEPDPYLQLEDVNHVEVLRGPQGTLYGAGSLGGLYRVVTNAPDMERYTATMNLETSLTKNGGKNGRVSATINVPLKKDQMALRVTGYLNHNAGYIDDVRLGLNNVNTTDVFGARARILWNVGERWELKAGMNFQDVIADDTQYFLQNVGTYKRENFVREPHEDDYFNPFVELKGRFGWGEIISTSAFIHRSIGDETDASLGVPLLTSLPVIPSVYKQVRKINMITNETRLVSRLGGRLDWLVGGFISKRLENYTSALTIPGSAAALPGGARSGDVAFSEQRHERTEELAAFGETIWHLPYDINLTGGVRWFYSDEQTRADIDGALGTAAVMRNGNSRDSGFTPKAAISWQASESTFFYAQRSQGYRVGGINLNSPDGVFFEDDSGDVDEDNDQTFEPDKLTMYEIGGKFSSQRGRIKLHVSAFTFKWNDIQTDQILPNGFSIILNAGYAQSRGVDFDISLEPIPGLTVNANLSLNDPDLVIVNPFLGSRVNDHLPGIPTIAGSINAEYIWSAGGEKQWVASADYSYNGRSQLTFARTDDRDAQSSNMLNFRLALENPSQWKIGLYVRNIFNEKANTFAFGNPFSFRQNLHHTPPVPQTIGISFKRQL
ncbi:MAG: hypothetical protein COA85_12295 [Robiginitomaculum sp.]|nr:MAG: hypothetical protein COA85_12295 [Robiginitomaculum sp.]